MMLSDISVKRPVFASVLALLLVVFGFVAFTRLPLREYPDVDPPIVSVSTTYPGASAAVIESRITQIIEDRVAGIEGVKFINSRSVDGRSSISIEFEISRNIEAAANDVRDRVSGVLNQLPDEANPPEVEKADADNEPILWLNLASEQLTTEQISDYAERVLVDQFSAVDGVARVRVGGQRTYAMRVWLDRQALASRGLTVADVERALRSENVEAPAGSLESGDMFYTLRIDRPFRTADDFKQLVVATGENGYRVRLGDVARVERGTVDDRSMFRGNGEPMVGLGIVKQSTANTVEVAQGAWALSQRLNEKLPDGLQIYRGFDGSVFIAASIREVYLTLFISVALVTLIIFLFLGSFKATLIPAVTVPVSVLATFIVLYALGLSINLLTLLGLVLAIGLVVDDAIVVLENIDRRMKLYGESALVAAYRGTREVGFAVIATTLVLIAVFVPITFMQGVTGKLFTEFALTISAAVAFSCLVALTLSPMMASILLRGGEKKQKGPLSRLPEIVGSGFDKLSRAYGRLFDAVIAARWLMMFGVVASLIASWFLFQALPREYTPREDRGSFFINVRAPEGASFEYTSRYMDEIERRLLPFTETGEVSRMLVRAPGFGGNTYNQGAVIVVLGDFEERRPADEIIGEINGKLSDLPGVRAVALMRQGLSGGGGQPVQVVLGGPSFEQLVEWRDKYLAALEKDNPGVTNIDWDYKETQPQFRIQIDYARAADLGVTVDEIGNTLQTMLGSRRVTTYIDRGEEYDVIVEGQRSDQSSPNDVENIFVRSARTGELIPLANLVTLQPVADSPALNRYNRVRAITIEAGLAEGVTLGTALDGMERVARAALPPEATLQYKGQSFDFKNSGGSILFVFGIGLLIVFLVLAAQFESWIHPMVIMLSIPATVLGGLIGIWLTGNSLNIYTQIGLIMLIGLAAKNGILVVEFANQLRDAGMEFRAALKQAAMTRLRPILMTGLTTAAGAVPLVMAHGAGAETRAAIGVVILFGIAAAVIVSLVVVPVAYAMLARGTGSPGDVERKLEDEARAVPDPKETYADELPARAAE